MSRMYKYCFLLTSVDKHFKPPNIVFEGHGNPLHGRHLVLVDSSEVHDPRSEPSVSRPTIPNYSLQAKPQGHRSLRVTGEPQ